MKNTYICILVLVACIVAGCTEQGGQRISSHLRAPAYPLITIDTYTNAWLFGDALYDRQPAHWTGKEFPLIGALRVDGEVYRFMGVENPLLQPLQRTSDSEQWTARYVTETPAAKWTERDFDARAWKQGFAAFGKRDIQMPATVWTSENIWVRREFELDGIWREKRLFWSILTTTM